MLQTRRDRATKSSLTLFSSDKGFLQEMAAKYREHASQQPQNKAFWNRADQLDELFD